MKNLIVCSDGTWKTPISMDRGVHATTNVVKLFKALYHNLKPITTNGQVIPPHLVFYDRGVGTGKFFDRIFGGATGAGLEHNVLDGYRFLMEHYEPGDKIFLFGFSRGAYTVRRLAGFICKFGLARPLPNPGNSPEIEQEQRKVIAEIYDRFLKQTGNDPAPVIDPAKMHEPDIEAVGVWDTVGAMGIPKHPLLELPRLLLGSRSYQFMGKDLSPKVKHGFHALALDEPRVAFEPTLWDHDQAREDNGTLLQVWFAGAHANIGGGYQEAGLSDIALQWMINRVKPLGLHFRGEHERTINADCLGELRDPRAGRFTKLLYHKKLRDLPQTPPPLVHDSVCGRLFPQTLYSYYPEKLGEFRKWTEGSKTYPLCKPARSKFYVATD